MSTGTRRIWIGVGRRLGFRMGRRRRHRGDDRRHHSRELSASDTELDYDCRRERSSSRARDSVEREWSEERRYHSSHKRKEHGNEENLDRSGKKARVSYGERDGKRERRRFEGRASDDLNGDSKEEKRDEKPSRSRRREKIAKDRDGGREDKRVGDEILSDGEEKRKPRKEARRFSDTVRVDKKEADNDDDQKEAKDEHMHKGRVKEETL
ncbi:hypothetical protein Cni_G11690 [Canna indica]|uniref:Uncharacterized protein n=1 Tax=Canna indica TaxID=4628 RepID=A0AAQ3QBZ3_9LILI|nr:hypothetical protein Cni_G11690 [Canna indica]